MSKELLSNDEIADVMYLIKECYRYVKEEGVEFTAEELVNHIICGEGAVDEADGDILERLCEIVILKRKGLLDGTINIQAEFDSQADIDRSMCVANIHLTEKGSKFLDSLDSEMDSREKENKQTKFKSFIGKFAGSIVEGAVSGVVGSIMK